MTRPMARCCNNLCPDRRQRQPETLGPRRGDYVTNTGIEDWGEHGTKERKEICSGTSIMATHAYRKGTAGTLGKKIDLQQWHTLLFNWRARTLVASTAVEDRNGLSRIHTGQ